MTFQLWKSAESGNLPKRSSETWFLGFSIIHFENKFLLYNIKCSRSQSFLAKRGAGIVETCGSRLTTSLCSAMLPVSIGFNPQEDNAKFFEFSSTEDGSPRAGRLSKTCPDVPNKFRVSSCKQESRLIIPLGLGILMGWLGTWDNPELLTLSGS